MSDPSSLPVSNSHYTKSDKLAIALTCGSFVMLIALFLAEKTPLVVALLVLLMVGFSVYPIFHFVRRGIIRVAALVAVLIVGGIFGREGLGHKKPTLPSASVHAEAQTQPSSGEAPAKQPTPQKKPKKGQSGTVKVEGNNNTAGTVNQEGNNNTAVVGNNNVTGNNNTVIIGPTVSGKGGFHEVAKNINVFFGSDETSTSLEAAAQGAVPGFINGTIPVRTHIKGDQITFSFKSWDAGLPIEVEDNAVTIGNELVDRNFSENAFEVVNKQGDPLFQMIRKNAGSIQINGIFSTGNISRITGKPVFLWMSDETGMEWKSTQPERWHLKPIFKYPAWKYPGVYAD